MGLNIIGDYHVHTNMAKGRVDSLYRFIREHAKGSIKSNVLVAKKRNLRQIAITNHGPYHIDKGLKPGEFRLLRKMIDELNYENNKNISREEDKFEILLGVESNIISRYGRLDIDDEIIQYLDIICAGFHRGALHKLDVRKNYTEAAIRAMERYEITVLHHPCEYVKPDIIEIGKVSVSRNTALEINEKHFDKNISIEDIKELKKIGVKFSLGSDSHVSGRVGSLHKTVKLALEAGLTNDDIINANGKAHMEMKILRKK